MRSLVRVRSGCETPNTRPIKAQLRLAANVRRVNLPGTAPEIFHFTVREDDVARHIEQVMGRRVAVAYEEHLGVPTSMFGETSHFVTDVRLTEVEGEKVQP